jgi:hypothetical protein
VLFAADFAKLANDQSLNALACFIAALQNVNDLQTLAIEQGCSP